MEEASHFLIQALTLRQDYMAMSSQGFASVTARFLRSINSKSEHVDNFVHDDKMTIAGKRFTFPFLPFFPYNPVIYCIYANNLEPKKKRFVQRISDESRDQSVDVVDEYELKESLSDNEISAILLDKRNYFFGFFLSFCLSQPWNYC